MSGIATKKSAGLFRVQVFAVLAILLIGWIVTAQEDPPEEEEVVEVPEEEVVEITPEQAYSIQKGQIMVQDEHELWETFQELYGDEEVIWNKSDGTREILPLYEHKYRERAFDINLLRAQALEKQLFLFCDDYPESLECEILSTYEDETYWLKFFE